MSLQYNNINVNIQGVPVFLCDSVTITESNPTIPIYYAGGLIPFDNAPSTYKSDISLSYYMGPIDLCYFYLLKAINAPYSITPFSLNIGNPIAVGFNIPNCYPSKYSIQLSPNNIIKAQTSFECYTPFNLLTSGQNSSSSAFYNQLSGAEIANYWSANFYSGSNIVTNNNILQLSYSVDISYSQIHTIGNPNMPNTSQVNINSIYETLNILCEQELSVGYSGQTLDMNRPDLQNLVITGINNNQSTTISLTGFYLKDTRRDITLNNILLFSNTYTRIR